MKTLFILFAMLLPIAAKPEARIFKAAGGTELRYRFSAPEGTGEGKTYPLILFLHGSGERGTDNNAQLRNGVKDILRGAEKLGQPVFLIAPQCPPEQWWAAPREDRLALRDAGGKNPLLDAVLAFVKEPAEKPPVHPNRFYLTGLSMGGFGTFDLLARSPQTWAAAIPICGAGDPGSVSKFKDIPIRIFHGADDEVVPPQGSELMAAALRKAGGKAELTICPGVGHNSWDKAYRDPEVIRWLLAQKRPD